MPHPSLLPTCMAMTTTRVVRRRALALAVRSAGGAAGVWGFALGLPPPTCCCSRRALQCVLQCVVQVRAPDLLSRLPLSPVGMCVCECVCVCVCVREREFVLVCVCVGGVWWCCTLPIRCLARTTKSYTCGCMCVCVSV